MTISELTNKELKNILRENNVKNYSKLTKKDLVKKVNQLIKAQNKGNTGNGKNSNKKYRLRGGSPKPGNSTGVSSGRVGIQNIPTLPDPPGPPPPPPNFSRPITPLSESTGPPPPSISYNPYNKASAPPQNTNEEIKKQENQNINFAKKLSLTQNEKNCGGCSIL